MIWRATQYYAQLAPGYYGVVEAIEEDVWEWSLTRYGHTLAHGTHGVLAEAQRACTEAQHAIVRNAAILHDANHDCRESQR